MTIAYLPPVSAQTPTNLSGILAGNGSFVKAAALSGLSWDGTTLTATASGGVTTFNTRAGAVTLTLADVTTVLAPDFIITLNSIAAVAAAAGQAGNSFTLAASAAAAGSGLAGGNLNLNVGAGDGAGAKGVIAAGGVIQAPNGTASIPALAFTNETNSGFYLRSVGGYLNLALQGTQKYEFNPFGMVIGPAMSYGWGTVISNGPDVQLIQQSGAILRVTAGNLTTPGMICGGSNRGLTAAGNSQNTAFNLLAGNFHEITTVAAGTGVGLLSSMLYSDMPTTVGNYGANALLVYPASGAQIDSLGANVGYSLAVGKIATFRAASATQWRSMLGA